MNWTLSNFLTLIRVAVIPLLIGLFYIKGDFVHLLMAVLFVFACITDFFDGYFARTWEQTTSFGRFLDPVADKLLITSVLFMLVGFGRIEGISLIPGVIILCREILVSGLREFLASLRIGLPVSYLAKWKTGIQMGALTCLLLGDSIYFSFLHLPINLIGLILLWCAGGLTLITGYTYLKESLQYFKDNPFS
ncbi:MAG: CDP-diacylglycerol--glycerol-3-phosphate 3-phosphatidyltransferase [Alphaproteobacteria bacterium 16-39-46]|nr:MAG: CDP-diacylglycerol--glycerol-3-phosphate 3-phosphatidyltransferase [Alphaproteobacteria bacterium 16-39-46]OZA44018.1 MAG: CDP-diacylglycerol--glycerol-3-phosphate 3-phosphatidyltransferase [Alphaproteobacteria bacterium 17-39-52]HQS84190.1 CDP-diacylglycerol--glycerol-3-phosphate 3-phosphatidyltransferase [Alphaproteobacteria bacterium]HQS93439.1 CDP-diacylglycerol--glycerol-3-phosphate 3-phosphatidyltransferase [Alphaproteobacteria bacterium]